MEQSELSTEQCAKIIKKKLNTSDFKILDFKLIPLDSRNGFLGEHRRLIIKISKNNKIESIHCFAKFLPENPAQIDFALICGVFKKEVFIYETLLPKIISSGIHFGNVVPECYYTEAEVLVFEDVTKMGYKPLSKYGYLDYDHVLVTIKSMVKLHAASLIYEEKMSHQLNRKYRLIEDFEDYFYETFYVDEPKHKGGQGLYASIKGLLTGFTIFQKEFPEFSEKFCLKLRQTCLDIFHLVKPSKKFRNCVCHGDLWSTNIMIKYNETKPVDCLMIDFQTVRYCPPGHDFMSFIFLTTTREFRRKYLLKLQQIYYQELRELLGSAYENIISFDEFLQSCTEQKKFAVVQTATYVQLTQVREKWIEEFIRNEDEWNKALYVDRSVLVQENCKNDPKYRACILETLKDLRDILI